MVSSLRLDYTPAEIQQFLFWFLLLNGIAVYYNNYYLVPKYLFNKKIVGYLLVAFLLVLIISFLLFHILLLKPPEAFPNFLYIVPNVVSILVLATGLRYYRWSNMQAKEIEELELKKQLSELAVLKSQVNPHFLFNTLNHIYAQAIKENAETTSESVVELSSLMRYMLQSGKKNIVPLSAELEYIQNYLALEKKRLQARICIDFQQKGDFSDLWLPPFLFIPFVENIFKHGHFPAKQQSPINIAVKRKEQELYFSCTNPYKKEKQKESTQIGLENIKKRLFLHFPDKHKLRLQPSDTTFVVQLTLSL